ncbi:MAG: hypothetical protein K2H20_00995, partial [Bacilli bacterium]|nr:hypothetical protein [Bacilli bacterium]
DQIVPKIAEQDINVYKVGFIKNDEFRSYPQIAHYELNKIKLEYNFESYITTAGILEDVYKTGKGLYSIGDLQIAKFYLNQLIYSSDYIETAILLRLYKAIIPKGAKYVVNEYNFYVSDSLIITDEVIDYIPKIKPYIIDFFKKYVPENNNEGSE